MTEANTINMEELYYKGLEPIDFARYTSPLPTEQFEELTSLGIGAEPTHIYNVLRVTCVSDIIHEAKTQEKSW